MNRLWSRRAGIFVLPLALAACFGEDRFPSADVIWVPVTLDGREFTAPATLTVRPDGTVDGLAPCNRFSGPWQMDETGIVIGPLVSTKMACPLLEEETAYLTALQSVTQADPVGDELTLDGGNHTIVFRTTD